MEHPTGSDDRWRRWFATSYLESVRPVAGERDLNLLVENASDQATARVWDADAGSVSDVLPMAVDGSTTLSPDGRWVVALDDGGGSEVGGLYATPLTGGAPVSLTPQRSAYVLRGLEFSADGSLLAATIVDDDGFHLLAIPADPWGEARVIYSSPYEAWYGHLSADGALACIDTTEHNPGVRRAAVTVVDVTSGKSVAVLNDLPAGPARAVRFSTRPGDARILVATERTGFARPALWDPYSGARTDVALAELEGEVMPLDWHAESGTILAVHVDAGVQRLLLCSESGTVDSVDVDGIGSFVNPDVANIYPTYFGSYFAPSGTVRVVGSRWDVPVHVREIGSNPAGATLITPADVPSGIQLTSSMVRSSDGTDIQLWWGVPKGDLRGTVLEVHGGPNLVAVDAFNPSAQAWMDAGFAYASLNYRGSVCFGQKFREGFWGVGGDREIEDIEAAVQWLRDQGLAGAASTFITGASYGGHLSLLALGRLPSLFAGGLAHVAMADWRAAYDDMNPALRTAWVGFLGGRPDEIPETLQRFSAINVVENVTGSAWLNQGTLDTRTPPEQARRYADTLRAAGGDVVIEWFDAGHEPSGLRALERDQARMIELAERTLAGVPWAAP